MPDPNPAVAAVLAATPRERVVGTVESPSLVYVEPDPTIAAGQAVAVLRWAARQVASPPHWGLQLLADEIEAQYRTEGGDRP